MTDTAHMGGVRMLSLKRSRVSTTWQDTAATRISVVLARRAYLYDYSDKETCKRQVSCGR